MGYIKILSASTSFVGINHQGLGVRGGGSRHQIHIVQDGTIRGEDNGLRMCSKVQITSWWLLARAG